jgi:hypothetical protein
MFGARGAEANASCNCGKPYLPATVRAAEAIKANPQKSNRAIADEAGISESTVRRAHTGSNRLLIGFVILHAPMCPRSRLAVTSAWCPCRRRVVKTGRKIALAHRRRGFPSCAAAFSSNPASARHIPDDSHAMRRFPPPLVGRGNRRRLRRKDGAGQKLTYVYC